MLACWVIWIFSADALAQPATAVAPSPVRFTPPPESAIPDTPLGDIVRLGRDMFVAPVGAHLEGRGSPAIAPAPQPASVARGATVFATHCAECHGANGTGMKAGTAYTFPPLWGSASYNAGAGMHGVETAAAFIKANMPLGQPDTLTDQQAWDVAAFINSKPRPPDPRKVAKR